MVIAMLKNYSKIKNIILPNKKINYFVFSVISIGFITGCIFLMLISNSDKEIVLNSVKNFVININPNRLEILKNVSIINFIYIILLIIFSLSLIGSILNIFIIYFKSIILGFTISSLVLTYNLKSIPIIISYLLPSQLLNLFIIYILGIYSLLFSFKIIRQVIYKKDNYIKIFIRKYIIIIIICLIITIISTIFESFIFPLLIDLIKNILKY